MQLLAWLLGLFVLLLLSSEISSRILQASLSEMSQRNMGKEKSRIIHLIPHPSIHPPYHPSLFAFGGFCVNLRKICRKGQG